MRGGGARDVGEGSTGAVSTEATALEAARIWCRHVRQIGVEGTGQISVKN